jgi:hypothetical protein
LDENLQEFPTEGSRSTEVGVYGPLVDISQERRDYVAPVVGGYPSSFPHPFSVPVMAWCTRGTTLFAWPRLPQDGAIWRESGDQHPDKKLDACSQKVANLFEQGNLSGILMATCVPNIETSTKTVLKIVFLAVLGEKSMGSHDKPGNSKNRARIRDFLMLTFSMNPHF